MAGMNRAWVGRRGAVLLIVLGVLVVLSLLAVTFTQISILDRDIATIYLDGIRAKLVARAGVERGVGEILSSVERGDYNDPRMTYWGSALDEQGWPDADEPIETAANPSYALEEDGDPGNASPRPLLVDIDGRRVGISGLLNAAGHAVNGDVFRLRVTDCNSMLHVNDGVENGNRGTVSLNLLRILDILGAQIGVADLGGRIVENRPLPGGYRSKREMEKVLGEADFAKARNFLTTAAWTDPNVVNPVPLSAEALGLYPVPYNREIGLYRYGRGMNANGDLIQAPLRICPDQTDAEGTDHAVMALDEVNAQWIERVRRAPVNVNLAPREILVALITDLRGWFITERRKCNPASTLYALLWYEKTDNAPGGKRGDEYGYLTSTLRFAGPGKAGGAGSSAPGSTVSAEAVADEIIACRGRGPSPNHPGLDYGSAWFGGPFRSWRQFNAFCDSLVNAPVPDPDRQLDFDPRGRLIDDLRAPLYYDHDPSDPPPTGYGWGGEGVRGSDDLVRSAIGPRWGSMAAADVLKANFNPNCTLNELNPDHNLFTIVDKTDLFVNSTEFCFTPMGVYEIECEGIVVATEDGGPFVDPANRRSVPGRAVARKKIVTVVKAYDVHKDATQADFHAGEAGLQPGHLPMTNNNCTMETGPEPDSGPAPRECRWSGWLQLSTIGGDWPAAGLRKARDSIRVAPSAGPERTETLHTHFTSGFDLHHSAAGQTRMLRNNPTFRNNPDRSEGALAGPYGPGEGVPGRYRLARDWNQQEAGPWRGAEHIAPSDLRVDGAYIERDSAVMWPNSADVFSYTGTMALWMKPSFHPGMTGKARTLAGFDAHSPRPNDPTQKICSLWFIPGHDTPAFTDGIRELSTPTYPPGPWRPSSLIMGASKGYGGVGMWTPSLNHRSHDDWKKKDALKKNGWTHVTAQWNLSGGAEWCTLWVNGELMGRSSEVVVHPTDPSDGGVNEYFTQGAPVRLGEPSKTWEFSYYWGHSGLFSRNWSADATIDEFYVWNRPRLDLGQTLYMLGRYARPLPNYEALYTSAELQLGAGERLLPPPSSTAAAPVVGGDPVAATRGDTRATEPRQARILAAMWTLLPEKTTPEGLPVMIDYHLDVEVPVEVELSFDVNRQARGHEIRGEGGPVGDVVFGEDDEIRYRLKIRIPLATVDTILHQTPVIDDVTIFHTAGPQYLSYELQEVAL